MALKNTRIGTDQRFALSLSNAGKKVNMNDVEVLHLCMYSNDQRSNDGSIGHAVNADDATVLDLLWLAKSQSYLGSHSVHGTIRYAGTVASFDVPAVNVVSRTSEADISTDTIVLEAPVGTEDLTATITIQGMGPQGPQGPKGDKMTYADLTQEDKEDLYEGGASLIKPLLATKQNALTDTDGSYGQRVAKLEKGKANLQHQHTVADITDFPELYYDATAFFTSAYPSEKYEELLEAVKAKKTVYATLDEDGNISYVFFTSLANSDASSSRVLLTTVFVDGSYLYLNTFVLRQSGMTRMQENITGKANKAKTLAGYGIADAYTKSELDALLKKKQDTLTAGNGISIEGGVISSTVDSLITPITYAELVALRNSSSLIPGMQYRITDYACTTTQENTQSAGHPFDIIVTADSENTLNEEARAIQHEGDTYFADCDLNAWKIWYCLDNDATRFAWADSVNGKGVIYRMIDEWNNDVPYDFKNIQFKRYILDANNAIATDVAKDGELNAVKTRLGEMSHRIHTSLWYYGEYVTDVYPDAEVGRKYVPFGDIFYNDNGPGVLCPINEANSNWFYTFSDTSFNDNTLTGQGNVHDNVVKSNKYALVTIDGEGRYVFEEQENICLNDIVFIGNYCYSNSFGNNCYSNSFGNSCNYNSFGNNCYSNSFGNVCNYNSFGNSCYSNSFGNYCYSNSFGNNCYSNSFGNSCNYNSFGNDCNSNSFGNNCYSNSFGNNCYYNSFGSNCYYNSFGNYCYYNSFGSNCYSNSFGNSCNSIKFASSSSATTKYNYYRQNHFGDGCQFIVFKGTETASDSAQVQNYNFAQGVQGTSNAYLTIDGVRSRAYETKVAKNSSGELKIYCEADLIQ